MNEKNIKIETRRTFKKENFEKLGFQEFLSKFSKGLMIPIAILPIAGLCLGLGAGLINIFNICGLTNDFAEFQDDQTLNYTPGLYILPTVVSIIGDVVFANLPILFGIAAGITFAKNYKGVAGLTVLVMWLVMNAFQGYFLEPNIIINADSGVEEVVSYDILFFNDVPTTIVAKNLGILSLQTSVFGGLTIGLMGAWITNKFSSVKMPKILGFFSETRLVPIMGFLFAPIIGAVFLLMWPWFGIQLNNLGASMAGMPFGLNSLLYGLISRSLLPFGLHHAFYTPLWFTSVGGNLYDVDGNVIASGDMYMWFQFLDESWAFNWVDYNQSDSLNVYIGSGSEVSMVNPIINPDTGETVGYITEGAKPGMYIQGYPDYIFGLPAAGFAMIMAADKGENRSLAKSVIGAAILTSFLTGITEPIQYTFLFVSPMLYVFHVIMFGMANWWMNLLGANLGVTFSGGFIDFMLYGFLPGIEGFHTRWWAMPIVGVAEAAIYFPVFYFYIKKFDIPTPGREGAAVELISKKEYQDLKTEKNSKVKKSKNNTDEKILELFNLIGGAKNIKTIDNCFSRLRLSVNDVDIIKNNEAKIKALGSPGIVYLGKNSIQIIIGIEAEKYKNQIEKIRKKEENV